MNSGRSELPVPGGKKPAACQGLLADGMPVSKGRPLLCQKTPTTPRPPRELLALISRDPDLFLRMRLWPGVSPGSHACQAELERHVGSEVLSEPRSLGEGAWAREIPAARLLKSQAIPLPLPESGSGRSQSPAEIGPQNVPPAEWGVKGAPFCILWAWQPPSKISKQF